MKKIKRFKITLRYREIVRLLKNTAQVSEITPQLEEAVKKEKEKIERTLSPAAVYETLQKEKIQFTLDVEYPEQWIAASFYAITLGEEVEEHVKSLEASDEHIMSKIYHCIFLEALEQASNFIVRLLADEAKIESCEISDKQKVTSMASLTEVFRLLSVQKINIQLLDSKECKPRYTTCGAIFWTPVKKRSAKK